MSNTLAGLPDESLDEWMSRVCAQHDDLRERLAEAVRLLKKVEWDEHAPTEIAAFLAKEREKG